MIHRDSSEPENIMNSVENITFRRRKQSTHKPWREGCVAVQAKRGAEEQPMQDSASGQIEEDAQADNGNGAQVELTPMHKDLSIPDSNVLEPAPAPQDETLGSTCASQTVDLTLKALQDVRTDARSDAMPTQTYSRAFETLRHGNWLNDDAIFKILGLFALPGTKIRYPSGRDHIHPVSQKVSPASPYVHIIAPVCYENHWTLLVIDLKKNRAFAYNSIKHGPLAASPDYQYILEDVGVSCEVCLVVSHLSFGRFTLF